MTMQEVFVLLIPCWCHEISLVWFRRRSIYCICPAAHWNVQMTLEWKENQVWDTSTGCCLHCRWHIVLQLELQVRQLLQCYRLDEECQRIPIQKLPPILDWNSSFLSHSRVPSIREVSLKVEDLGAAGLALEVQHACLITRPPRLCPRNMIGILLCSYFSVKLSFVGYGVAFKLIGTAS